MYRLALVFVCLCFTTASRAQVCDGTPRPSAGHPSHFFASAVTANLNADSPASYSSAARGWVHYAPSGGDHTAYYVTASGSGWRLGSRTALSGDNGSITVHNDPPDYVYVDTNNDVRSQPLPSGNQSWLQSLPPGNWRVVADKDQEKYAAFAGSAVRICTANCFTNPSESWFEFDSREPEEVVFMRMRMGTLLIVTLDSIGEYRLYLANEYGPHTLVHSERVPMSGDFNSSEVFYSAHGQIFRYHIQNQTRVNIFDNPCPDRTAEMPLLAGDYLVFQANFPTIAKTEIVAIEIASLGLYDQPFVLTPGDSAAVSNPFPTFDTDTRLESGTATHVVTWFWRGTSTLPEGFGFTVW